MRTAARKNAKRRRRMEALRRSDAQRYRRELHKLARGLAAEALWRANQRANGEDVASPMEVIEIAARYGLEGEITADVISAVAQELGGPTFASHSVHQPPSRNPDVLRSWRRRFDRQRRDPATAAEDRRFAARIQGAAGDHEAEFGADLGGGRTNCRNRSAAGARDPRGKRGQDQ